MNINESLIDRQPEDPAADDDENSANGTFNEDEVDNFDLDEEECEDCGELLDYCVCEDEDPDNIDE